MISVNIQNVKTKEDSLDLKPGTKNIANTMVEH